MVVNSDTGAAEANDVFLSHVIARAIEAVCLRIADPFDLETFMQAMEVCSPDRRPLTSEHLNTPIAMALAAS